MKVVKDPSDASECVSINGRSHSVAELRDALLMESAGDSIAYLTDFLLDEAAMTGLADALKSCTTIVCESQYRHSDLELSRKNFHMTTMLTGQLARRAAVGRLVLFHLSDRYQPADWLEMLSEAREQFPNTTFPPSWKLL